MKARLYTVPNCPACETARRLLADYEVTEMPADDPLITIAIKTMFREWFAPLIVIEDDVFVVGDNRLLRVVIKEAA